MPDLIPILAAGDLGWTLSRYMPDVKVEIAFNAGFTTPAADRVWTDVSEYVELADRIGIAFGRQDERSTADANSLSLTLDNSDGRFTANRSASPYYPNVKIGRPIRVSVMTVTGHTSVRFVGFVDEWPVAWDGTDAYASASIRATSRLARLGLSAKLRSMLEETILADSPSRYWTMGDPSGSTSAAESSGSSGSPLTTAGSGTAVVFGDATGPALDGLTAATFAAGAYLTTELGGLSGVQSLRASVRLLSLPPGFDGYVVTGGGLDLRVSSAGLIRGPGTTGPSINDGLTHDVVLVRNGTNEILYVDGVLVDSVAASALGTLNTFLVGYRLNAVIAHVALYAAALSGAVIAEHAEATTDSFAGDRTDERLSRILEWAGVAATEVTTETGVETMTYQETSGQSVVEVLRDVESTECGVLFDGRDGNVTFHNRSHRYTQPVAATFDMAAQHVGADFAPKLDRSTLANDVTVENPTSGESARAVDTDSADEYGIATASSRSLADTYDPLQQKAGWLIASYAEPRSRVPSLTVDVLAHVGATPSAEDILNLTIGDRIQVTNQPTQADATTADYFIEGYTETIGPESYEVTFNLSPGYPYLNVVVLDDPARGLDSGSILAL